MEDPAPDVPEGEVGEGGSPLVEVKYGSYEEFRRLLDEIEDKKIVHHDYKDFSCHPSYSKFEVPYFMVCRERYLKKKEELEAQFQHEIATHVKYQASAYDAARLTRHLAITTMWPPLHSHREIRNTERYFRLNKKQQKRLDYLMATDII